MCCLRLYLDYNVSSFLQEVDLLAQMREYDPHRFLGPHPMPDGSCEIRIWRPGSKHIFMEVKGHLQELIPTDPRGLFIYKSRSWLTLRDYRVYQGSSILAHDPYAFSAIWGAMDQYLFSQGRHYELARVMGARRRIHEGIEGTNFCVWAPNARSISLICDSNFWNVLQWPMRSLGNCGVWEIFIPAVEPGEKYKFEIHTHDGGRYTKADPYALQTQLRPDTASIVASEKPFPWTDQHWMRDRTCAVDEAGYLPRKYNRPMNIYELHVGSWMRKDDGSQLNYRELAHELVRYCDCMGYTHVELLPVMEHPLDQSWGYQVTGYFSISARWGNPSDFQYFINYLHVHEVGVILDWVPAHFPCDAHALARFDGSALYEHEDPRMGFHPHWKTYIFNYGRHEVSNFLLASALYWCKQMHVDGLRVDAVASMIYLDYGREEGEWLPNCYGGRENLEALEFLRHLNSILHKECPGVLTIAEESTSFTGVTHRLEQGGLGFDFKWNMGWMNDTLRYISRDAVWRKWHQNELTFALVYAFSERFMLVLSHDEVVHEKKSLIEKIPGDEWQKFAGMRLLHSYMMCMPGKKLLFMGQDMGQRHEWDHRSSVCWQLLQVSKHRELHKCIAEMNHFYLSHSELWHDDVTHNGFSWVDFSDHDNSVIAYFRSSPAGLLLCIHHFAPEFHPTYKLELPGVRKLREVFNSDAAHFGGSRLADALDIYHEVDGKFTIQLAPLATQIFEAHR